jgi:hypothetical protein
MPPAALRASRCRPAGVLLAFKLPQVNMEVPIYMLRRITIIAAAAAMLGLSALPASAATMKSNTHSISFPGLHGLNAWGNYTKSGAKVRINVCVAETLGGVFAAGAVTTVSNANNSRHSVLGAVAIGHRQSVCTSETLHYTNHLHVYTFIGGNNGTIRAKSVVKTIY